MEFVALDYEYGGTCLIMSTSTKIKKLSVKWWIHFVCASACDTGESLQNWEAKEFGFVDQWGWKQIRCKILTICPWMEECPPVLQSVSPAAPKCHFEENA